MWLSSFLREPSSISSLMFFFLLLDVGYVGKGHVSIFHNLAAEISCFSLTTSCKVACSWVRGYEWSNFKFFDYIYFWKWCKLEMSAANVVRRSLAFRPSLGPCTARSRGGSDVKVTPLWCLGAVESTPNSGKMLVLLEVMEKLTPFWNYPPFETSGELNGEVWF